MSEQKPDQKPKRKTPANGTGGGGMRLGRGVFGWVLFIGLAIMLFVLVQQQRNTRDDIPISEFYALVKDGKVRSVTVQGDELLGELTAPRADASQPDLKLYRVAIPPADWSTVRDLMVLRENAPIESVASASALRVCPGVNV